MSNTAEHQEVGMQHVGCSSLQPGHSFCSYTTLRFSIEVMYIR
jgi:hypothetical protein